MIYIIISLKIYLDQVTMLLKYFIFAASHLVLMLPSPLLAAESLSKPPSYLWDKTYSGTAEEAHGHYIIQTKDGGYAQIKQVPLIAGLYIL
jgi:hypothetical protein